MSNQLHKSWFGKMQKEEESRENGNDNDKEDEDEDEDEDEGDMSNQIAKQLVRENAEKERKQQQQLGAEKGKIASAKVRRLTSWHWKSKKLRQEIQKKLLRNPTKKKRRKQQLWS